MAACVSVTLAYIIFQLGESHRAVEILTEAQSVLQRTDDRFALGNLESSLGRIARRKGRYKDARTHFKKSLAEYRACDPSHGNMARALTSLAFVNRLIALRLDQEKHRGTVRALRREAHTYLDSAQKTYTDQKYNRGLGSVHVRRAFLHLDEGKLSEASLETRKAFDLGESGMKPDFMLMSRANILECMIENQTAEGACDEDRDLNCHAEAARSSAEDALRFAGQIDSPRLQARALIWYGVAMSNDLFRDFGTARASCQEALRYLQMEEREDRLGRDYVWDELAFLNCRLPQPVDLTPSLDVSEATRRETGSSQEEIDSQGRGIIDQGQSNSDSALRVEQSGSSDEIVTDTLI